MSESPIKTGVIPASSAYFFGTQGQSTGRSQSVGKLFSALAKAQGEMGGAGKDGINSYDRPYTSLASALKACRDALSKNGIAIIQATGTIGDGTPYVDTILGIGEGEQGEWISTRISMKPEEMNPHGIGSAYTYMRRYSLMAMVGIAPDDDDGAGAMAKGKAVSTQGNTKTDTQEPKRDREVLQDYPGQRVTNYRPVTEDGETYHVYTLGNRAEVFTQNSEAVKALSSAGDKPFDFKVKRRLKGDGKPVWELLEFKEAK